MPFIKRGDPGQNNIFKFHSLPSMKIQKPDTTFPNKTEMLHSAIHQMSRSEKRSFRLEMNKLKQGNRYEIAFDYLVNAEDGDVKLFHQFMKKKEVNNPHMVVNYLFDKIISHLGKMRLSLNKPAYRAKIEQLLANTDTAFLLGFYKHAHKLVLRALKLAYHHEEYRHIARGIHMAYCIESQFNLTGLSDIFEEYTDSLDVRENMQRASKLQEIDYISCILYDDIIAYQFYGGTSEQLEKVINDDIMKLSPKEAGFKNTLKVLRIEVRYYDIKKDYENVIKNGIRLIRIQEQYPRFTVQKFKDFMADYAFICRCMFLAKDKRLEVYTEKYSNLLFDWDNTFSSELKENQIKMYKSLHHVNNVILKKQNLLRKEHFTLKDIESLNTREMLNWSQTLLWNYTMSNIFSAYLCLLIREYKTFHHYKILIIEGLKKRPRHITQWEVEVMCLIEYYENSDEGFFIFQLNKIIRKSRKDKNIPPTLIFIIKSLKHLSKSQNNTREFLVKALPEIMRIESDYYKPHLPFSIWVKWRSEGK